jgi:hypothetical protein
MKKALFLLGGCMLATTGIAAPPPDPGAPPPPAYRRLFISPMGEPFRGKGNEDQVARWFRGADIDQNGRLTLSEFVADAARFFKTLDQDHDGQIAGPEIDHFEYDIAPEMSGLRSDTGGDSAAPHEQPREPPRHHRGKPGGGRSEPGGFDPMMQGAARYGILDIPEPVTSADSDFNGRVSWQEYQTAVTLRFGLLDTNKDSALELSELPKLEAPQTNQPDRRHRGRK